MAGLTERMLGAAKLDAATHEEVENDATATPQAARASFPAPRRRRLCQLLRTVGSSATPGLSRAIGIIRSVDELVAILASLWMLAAMVVGGPTCAGLRIDGPRGRGLCERFAVNFAALSAPETVGGLTRRGIRE